MQGMVSCEDPEPPSLANAMQGYLQAYSGAALLNKLPDVEFYLVLNLFKALTRVGGLYACRICWSGMALRAARRMEFLLL